MNNKVIFRFEASPSIGAGHAIRSMVLANRFKELKWDVKIATSIETYNFISALKHITRVEPSDHIKDQITSDVLVIDSYDIDASLEKQFRMHSKKIVVIDDLANRMHDCDILIDQTYNRNTIDYTNCVSSKTEILTGIKYALIRDEFVKLKKSAFDKRKKTKKINKILVTMGGSDPNNTTLNAIKEIEKSEFKGEINIVLGFCNPLNVELEKYIKKLSNKINIYINANMSKLIYESDLAMGASGSGIWERLCLFLPNILYVTANNQKVIFDNLIDKKIVYDSNSLNKILSTEYQSLIYSEDIVDGLGANRILEYIL